MPPALTMMSGVLSFLKKSTKREFIEGLIRKLFKVRDVVEEEKDIIFFID